ncbi:MAG: PmoA family protein [Candidatus Hydrogenedentes bacterium]|nr:PmoA family protein [Candidatus Hydrogenedentota bacterium]
MQSIKWSGLFLWVILLAAGGNAAEPADGFTVEQGLDAQLNGKTWLRTVTTPFDKNNPELAYKVYTHLYDFEGAFPITKGSGGKYSHHRGLFIGWKATHIGDSVVDTWHMRTGKKDKGREIYAHQQLEEWISFDANENRISQTARILWAAENMEPFIEEERTLVAYPGEKGMRVVDFISVLKTLAGPIQLRGDAQHAGMQIRMANEVSEHENETEYILPDGAVTLGNDIIDGAWWICGSMPIGGKRYWIVHLTSPELITGQPQYSARLYGRFGAFFEPDLKPGVPLRIACRIILSETPLDQKQCEDLYQQYKQDVEKSS